MANFQSVLDDAIAQLRFPENPKNLYAPLNYFMKLGGKRTRPSLLLMAHDLFGDGWEKSVPNALGIELFHNFTLIHDDIMDKAELRRSQPTIHVKWNDDIAILSGDVLFVKAYDYMIEGDESSLKTRLNTFNYTAQLVCEGQQMDMDFESRDDVNLIEYLQMIKLKTAVLLGCSLKIGALNGGASIEAADKMYEFGVHIGVGFQLQDDYLDAFGNPETFGKKVGGDILNNKMTYLSIILRDKIGTHAYKDLLSIEDETEKIEEFKAAVIKNGINLQIIKEVENHHNKGIEFLNSIPTKKPKDMLLGLASKLMIRNT